MAEKAVVRLTASDETSRAFASVRQSLAVLQGQAATVGGAFRTLTTGFRAFGGALVGGFAVNQIIQISDSYKNVATQLSNATNTANELVTAQSRIFEIAQRTRQSYTQLANTYAQISAAAGASIGTQAEQLQFFDTLSKTIALSGASADQASAALLQFRQGLAAGALRGEELNSVMEQTPRLARALAEGLGVGIGQLREMGAAGELTSDRIIEALSRVAPTIDAEFAKIVPTVESSLTKLGNSFGRLIERIEKETGGPLLELGRFIGWIADNIDRLTAVTPLADRIAKITRNIADAEQGRGGFQGLSREERDQFIAQARQQLDALKEQTRRVFREGENQTMQAEFERQRVAGERATSAWKKLADTYASNAEKAKKAADEIRKAGEAAGKSEAEIQRLIAASNARFAGRGGAKSRVSAADPLFDLIAAGEVRESERQRQAEESFRALQRQEEASARFEEAETDRLRKVAEGWRNATDATKKFVDQYEEVMQAVALGPAQGGMSEDEGALARFLLGNETDGVFAKLDETAVKLNEFTLQAARNIQDTLGQGLYDVMEGNFSSIGRLFGDMVKRMIAEAASADLARLLLGDYAKTGAVGGAFGTALGFLFGGARAAGGPVSGGTSYLVGEQGPELFVPSSNGYIVPNGAGGVTIQQTISVGSGVSRGEVMTAMSVAKEAAKREIAESMRRGGVFA